jgi:ribosomal protein S12 methylthiotransferase accessory factor
MLQPLGITRVANVTGLDCIGIPVVMVCRPNGRSVSVSQGKGIDLDAARASGLMEALELYHAERITHPLKLASQNELRFTHDLAAVEGLPRTTLSTYHADQSILWIKGWELMSSTEKWLPFELVHTNFCLPLPTGSGSFVLSSNGLASGNHPVEAVVHGLCEVIERDAEALFRLLTLEEQEERRIDLRTIESPTCRELLKRYADAGVAVGVWDTTTDVGIATIRAVVADVDRNPFRQLPPVFGSGCHPVREVALSRALTEAAQGRLTLIAGARDDNGYERYAESRNERIYREASKRLQYGGGRSFAAVPSRENATLEEDLAGILAELGRAGLAQVLVVDLTKPEFGIPVARVVVPGLETYHHIPGYVPGARALRTASARHSRVSS